MAQTVVAGRRVAPLRDGYTSVRLRGERIRLHHVSAGPVGEPPLLLLHGMVSSWRQWRTTLLRSDLPCAALDLPGFGLSATTAQPLQSGDYADAAEAWCRAQGWPALAAVGHSFGGAVLADWASRYPERFRAIGLLAPAAVFHPWYTSGYGLLRRPILGPLLMGPVIWLISTRTLGRRAFGHIASDLGLLQADEMGDLQWGCRRSREMRRALDYYRFPGLQQAMGRIPCPAWVGWGTADRVVPFSDAAYYLAGLPRAELVRWDGCGHVPMYERREECDRLLRTVWEAGREA